MMHKVSAILLAAGLSSRMGTRNKLLLPVNGIPLVRQVACAYLDAIDGPVIVVTGFEADHVCTALKGLRIQIVHNERFAEGQPRSVATGLAQAPASETVLIGLCDQPLLTPQDITILINAHQAGDTRKITIPIDAERRGNPIVIPHDLQGRLMENPDRPGCMRFTRDHPEHVQAVPLNSPGFYTDIDTPKDYAAIVGTEAKDIA